MRHWTLWISVLSLGLVLGAPPAAAQPVISPTENVDFDRPEAWAMKYFASVSLLTGFGPPKAREPGSVEVALEAGWIPHLSEEERTVGFNGTKTEDLNRFPAFVRPRVIVGLPGKVSFLAGWVPPLEIDGLEANLFALGFERPLVEREAWGLGARLYGQIGTIEGDLTCTDSDVRFEPGSEGNPFGCEAPSDDEADLSYAGFELVGSYELTGDRAPDLHLGLAANWHDQEFQVDALTFGFRDRTLLLADGWTWSINAGATWPLSDSTRFGVEAFYSPLSVDRPVGGNPQVTTNEQDDLLNARVLFGWSIR